MILRCCKCNKFVEPRLTDGKEIYSHRPDLSDVPFWKCDYCGNHVGCHHKTKDRTRPLGSIPSPKIRKLRKELHERIDDIWRDLRICSRSKIYSLISKHLGKKYHAAEVNTKDEFDAVISALSLALDEL